VIPQNASGLNFHFVRWSPDGRSILGVDFCQNDLTGALLAFDSETGKSKVIARYEKDGYIFQPEWAPDSQSVFFTRKIMNNRKILRHDIETGAENVLFDSPRPFMQGPLSPDGKQLVFYDGKSIWLLSTNGGEPRELIPVKDVNSMTWSADGRFLFYGKKRDSKSYVFEVWRTPVEGGEPQKLDLAMTQLMHLRMHPSGRKIAFTASIRPQTSEIWVMENFLPKAQDKKKD
jgi:Tol biopolymer transport system component